MTEPGRTLSGRVAIITGAGSGVGRATAIALAGAGMPVVLAGRRLGPLEAVAEQVSRAGGTALCIPADISREEDVARLVGQAVDRFGGVDVLVGAAGIGVFGPVEGYALADWQRTLATNVTGLFLTSRAVLGAMRDRGGGDIIAISSGAGKQGYANLAAYSASKFAVHGFMQSLAAEVGSDGIRVSTIAPGSILTDFGTTDEATKRANQGDKRYLEAADVAEAVLFLLRQPDRAWTQDLNLWPR